MQKTSDLKEKLENARLEIKLFSSLNEDAWVWFNGKNKSLDYLNKLVASGYLVINSKNNITYENSQII